LFIVSGALAVESRPWALVLAVISATFVTQSDVGPGVAVAAMALLVGVAFLLRWRRQAWRVVGGSILILAVLWLPTLIDQLSNSPGNAGRLLSFFENGGTGQGRRSAAALFTFGVTFFPLGAGGTVARTLDNPSGVRFAMAAIFLVLVALGAVIGFRTDRRMAGWMCAISLVGLVASLPAVFEVRDLPYAYLVMWLAGIALTGWIGVVCSLVPAVVGLLVFTPNRTDRVVRVRFAARLSAVALSVALVAASGGATWKMLSHFSDRPWLFDNPSINAGVSMETIDYLRSHHKHRPLVEMDQRSWAVAAALVDDLDRAGFAVTVPAKWVHMYDSRFADHHQSDVKLRVTLTASQDELDKAVVIVHLESTQVEVSS